MKEECFGEMLKQFRLEYLNIGLRRFAEKINMKPSDLSDIENSYKDWPRETLWFIELTSHFIDIKKPVDTLMCTTSLHQAWLKPFEKKERSKGFVIFAIDSETGMCVTDPERIKKINDLINDGEAGC
jgi:hypothetical protein